jgi:hypothetical protein
MIATFCGEIGNLTDVGGATLFLRGFWVVRSSQVMVLQEPTYRDICLGCKVSREADVQMSPQKFLSAGSQMGLQWNHMIITRLGFLEASVIITTDVWISRQSVTCNRIRWVPFCIQENLITSQNFRCKSRGRTAKLVSGPFFFTNESWKRAPVSCCWELLMSAWNHRTTPENMRVSINGVPSMDYLEWKIPI